MRAPTPKPVALPAPCRCGAYLFPHRRGLRCSVLEDEIELLNRVPSRADIAAEELASFDRIEAAAINSGRL